MAPIRTRGACEVSRLEAYAAWRLKELEQVLSTWVLTEARRDDAIEVRKGWRVRVVDEGGQRGVLVRAHLTPEEAERMPERIGAALDNLAETALELSEAPFIVELITAEQAELIVAEEARALRGH